MANRIPPHFSTQVRYHRRRRKWTQSHLSRLTGIERRRIGVLEQRLRPASLGEMLTLSRALCFRAGVTRVSSRIAPVAPHLLNHKRNLPPVDRPFAVRLNAARRAYGSQMSGLEASWLNREDVEELPAFLQDVPFDSSLEVLAAFRLLEMGAMFGYDSPGRYGYFGPAIIEPQTRENIAARARPTFYFEGLAMFPQVCFWHEETIRVDYLACRVAAECIAGWCVLELDGPGHSQDSSRRAFTHPVARFVQEDVLASRFPALVQREVLQLTEFR